MWRVLIIDHDLLFDLYNCCTILIGVVCISMGLSIYLWIGEVLTGQPNCLFVTCMKESISLFVMYGMCEMVVTCASLGAGY